MDSGLWVAGQGGGWWVKGYGWQIMSYVCVLYLRGLTRIRVCVSR